MLYIRGKEVPTYPIIFMEDEDSFWVSYPIFERNMCFLDHYRGVLDPINHNCYEFFFNDDNVLEDEALEDAVEEIREVFKEDSN